MHIAKNKISGVLLAAGRSRRMGAFKPLLPFGRSTAVETCIENLMASGIEDIRVVVGYKADEMAQALQGLRVTLVVNDDLNSPMSASIALGVAQIREPAEAVLIALVDQPGIPAEVIVKLREEYERTGAHILLPRWNQRPGHPVLISLRYRDNLMNLDPQRGLRAFIHDNRDKINYIDVDCRYVAWDMNTREEYEQIHQDIFRRPPACPK